VTGHVGTETSIVIVGTGASSFPEDAIMSLGSASEGGGSSVQSLWTNDGRFESEEISMKI
jgi:hypothetical protein